jgi:hypothetical protein
MGTHENGDTYQFLRGDAAREDLTIITPHLLPKASQILSFTAFRNSAGVNIFSHKKLGEISSLQIGEEDLRLC